jgi:hypothetical protein
MSGLPLPKQLIVPGFDKHMLRNHRAWLIALFVNSTAAAGRHSLMSESHHARLDASLALQRG